MRGLQLRVDRDDGIRPDAEDPLVEDPAIDGIDGQARSFRRDSDLARREAPEADIVEATLASGAEDPPDLAEAGASLVHRERRPYDQAVVEWERLGAA
jgi:hypothetical protein